MFKTKVSVCIIFIVLFQVGHGVSQLEDDCDDFPSVPSTIGGFFDGISRFFVNIKNTIYIFFKTIWVQVFGSVALGPPSVLPPMVPPQLPSVAPIPQPQVLVHQPVHHVHPIYVIPVIHAPAVQPVQSKKQTKIHITQNIVNKISGINTGDESGELVIPSPQAVNFRAGEQLKSETNDTLKNEADQQNSSASSLEPQNLSHENNKTGTEKSSTDLSDKDSYRQLETKENPSQTTVSNTIQSSTENPTTQSENILNTEKVQEKSVDENQTTSNSQQATRAENRNVENTFQDVGAAFRSLLSDLVKPLQVTPEDLPNHVEKKGSLTSENNTVAAKA